MHPLNKLFKAKEKSKQTGILGLEVEHFVLNKSSKYPMPYDEISKLLEYLMPYYPVHQYEENRLIALESDHALLTLEPGCQLEVSLACMSNLEDIKRIYLDTIQPINSYLEAHNYQLVYSGGLPSVAASQVKRIDKKRYEFMENYFLKSGTRGLEMMKATAAVHVSIDYANEVDFVKKYRMANILHPVFAFLSSNTKMYAGKENPDLLLRDSIWANTDPQRCSIIPSLFDTDFGYHSYVQWLESLPLILMHDGQNFLDVGQKTCKEVADEYGWDEKYIPHYLSMSFLDVRLKQFIEIRSADSMPIDYTVAYCALIKGLFYNEENIEKYSKLVNTKEAILSAKDSIRKHDWDANVYGEDIYAFCINLICDAKKGLNEKESYYLTWIENLVLKKTHIFKEIGYEL